MKHVIEVLQSALKQREIELQTQINLVGQDDNVDLLRDQVKQLGDGIETLTQAATPAPAAPEVAVEPAPADNAEPAPEAAAQTGQEAPATKEAPAAIEAEPAKTEADPATTS